LPASPERRRHDYAEHTKHEHKRKIKRTVVGRVNGDTAIGEKKRSVPVTTGRVDDRHATMNIVNANHYLPIFSPLISWECGSLANTAHRCAAWAENPFAQFGRIVVVRAAYLGRDRAARVALADGDPVRDAIQRLHRHSRKDRGAPSERNSESPNPNRNVTPSLGTFWTAFYMTQHLQGG
jgi:hypothetical protein